jgi:hypothetical protein
MYRVAVVRMGVTRVVCWCRRDINAGMFEVLYLGRGSCGTWEEEGAGGGENTAVAEPEFTCTHMTYTFTYMIVFTCLYFVLHVCTRYLYRIRYQYTRRNTIHVPAPEAERMNNYCST